MNAYALQMLNRNNVDLAFQALLKCQEIYKKTPYKFDISLTILTMNHLACCFKQIGQPQVSKKLLNDTIHLIYKKSIFAFRGMTYLNKCAALSILNEHEQAFQNAKLACEYFSKEIQEMDVSEGVDLEEFKAELNEKIKLLTISYYNMSIEAEHIKNFKESYFLIKEGLNLYQMFLEEELNLKSLFRK